MIKLPYPRILFWDVETTNLKADFGRMLCFAYQWSDEKRINLETIRDTKAFKNGKPWEDGELIRKAHKVLIQADGLVHHFGDRFDLKFFKTRLIELGLYFPPVHTVDTWKVAKKHLLLQSNRMANIADFLGGEQKTGIKKREWVKSNGYHEPSLKKLEAYCKQDVKTLRGVYEKLKPYCNNVNMNLFVPDEGCPTCSSKRIISNGIRATPAVSYRRLNCQECGTWFKGPVTAVRAKNRGF